MTFTTEQVDAMRVAIATGALSARNANGEMVTYRTLAEMRSVLDMMEQSVSGRPRATFINPAYERGL